MLSHVYDAASQALGLDLQGHDLTFTHMALRSVIVFCFAIILARIADRRFMGNSACFDFMLGIILGSVLSRGINGQAAFFPTLGVSALLVLFHRAVGTLAFHSHWFSELVKGDDRLLVRDGKVIEEAMRRSRMTYGAKTSG